MLKKEPLSPIISAAAGAAFFFYGASALGGSARIPFFSLLFILLLVLLCVLESLNEFLFSFPSHAAQRQVRRLLTQLAAFSIGASIGSGACCSLPVPAQLGIPDTQVRGLRGILLDDPRHFPDGPGMAFLELSRDVPAVSGLGGVRSSGKGRVMVFFPSHAMPRLKEFGRKSEVYLEGLMQENRGKTADALIFRASAAHIIRAPSGIQQFRTLIRMNMLGRLEAQPWGALAAALLLGVRDKLSDSLSDDFRDAGCSHILALSGMHLAVISGLIALVLKKPLGIRVAAAAGGLLISAYVYLVGALPSLIRAALMYIMGSAAVFWNLPRKAGVLLSAAFLMQLAADPSSGNSLSFIFSYLALAGILSAGTGIQFLLKGRVPDCILNPSAASAGAFLGTSAVTAVCFGVLRPAGMASSLVLTPLISVFMLVSLLWLIGGALFPPLGAVLGTGLSHGYAVIGDIISWGAAVPGFGITRKGTAALFLVLFTAALILVSRRAEFRMKGIGSFDQL
ncbi:ComEC/Rec2 family competence protein [Treponema sp. OttesenSCG-928-L16]|nr:ComEC/Rec2 family competence protein [Treponema sp. OttesenSCG-928-L16]